MDMKEDGRVRLNVGGQLFETSVFTLTRYRDTVLATMVEERWTSTQQDQEIFIDRDPTNFNRILNFLRDGAEFFIMPKDDKTVEELRKESLFYGITDLVALCDAFLAPFQVGDTVGWRPEAIPLYWRSFVRYMVDDTLTLPFIYDRNNHILAKCIACQEFQDPKSTYLVEINYLDWEPMKHHMEIMTADIVEMMGRCCNVSWDNGQQIHLPCSALRRASPAEER
ncbi:unnamed protein product, partial [Mesorhabditis belari]|uniref:BTB domain-containing protein n=1 Tax=Mesorhabditis belari TaxID=2138241 RepID=A0AAF3F0H8_9BILA